MLADDLTELTKLAATSRLFLLVEYMAADASKKDGCRIRLDST